MAEIPERWLNCPKVGRPVEDTFFIPFKTPLKEKYDELLPEPITRFHLNDLFAYCDGNGMNLGLIIDLTKTGRYYDSKEVLERGIKYEKIICQGHGETPEEDAINKFNLVVSSFLKECEENGTDKKYIGVHCTHGFNRTGFLICAYLVKEEDRAIDAAVHQFSVARYV